MVDTQYLEDKIDDSGKSKTYLANKIGCHLNTLIRKINNLSEFTTGEVKILCDELNLTWKEAKLIFFKENVDEKVTL